MGVHRTDQATTARAAGVTRQTIAELVTEVRAEPSLRTLYSVAAVFAVEPDDLLRRPFLEWAPAYFEAMTGDGHEQVWNRLHQEGKRR